MYRPANAQKGARPHSLKAEMVLDAPYTAQGNGMNSLNQNSESNICLLGFT
jgi:hypothetical protein